MFSRLAKCNTLADRITVIACTVLAVLCDKIHIKETFYVQTYVNFKTLNLGFVPWKMMDSKLLNNKLIMSDVVCNAVGASTADIQEPFRRV